MSLSGLLCSRIKCGSVALSADPLNTDSDWSCTGCDQPIGCEEASLRLEEALKVKVFRSICFKYDFKSLGIEDLHVLIVLVDYCLKEN